MLIIYIYQFWMLFWRYLLMNKQAEINIHLQIRYLLMKYQR